MSLSGKNWRGPSRARIVLFGTNITMNDQHHDIHEHRERGICGDGMG
jgi:hypothetical protein